MNDPNAKNRNSAWDFLKFTGLSAVILAHVGPPEAVMYIRSFDVPLMVLLSALLAKDSCSRRLSGGLRPWGYVVSRVRRLVLPTWLFLTFYFAAMIIWTGRPESGGYYLASYALTRYGIRYVWVILIYLYISALVPLYRRAGLSAKSAAAVMLVYAVYEICCRYQVGLRYKAVETTLYYAVPYGSAAYLGYHYTDMRPGTKYTVLALSAAVFAALLAYGWISGGAPQSLQAAKYPPRLYYLSYGIACSFALFIFCERHPLKCFSLPLFRYVSDHSLWIYLWHILWLTVCDALRVPQSWLVRYLAVYAGSVLTVFAVGKCLDLIGKRTGRPIPGYLRR